MQVCSDCGAANEDNEDFCGQCGSYLEWDATRAAAEADLAAAPVEPEPEPAEQPLGLVGRVREAVGLGSGAGATDGPADTSPEPSAPPPMVGAVAQQPTDQVTARGTDEQDAGSQAEAPTDAPTQSDASTLVVKVPPPAPKHSAPRHSAPGHGGPGHGSAVPPTPTPTGPGARPPAPEQPGAVRPGAAAPKARRSTRVPADERVDPGDLICGECGAGNKPTRKFCRRCGRDLVEAVVAKVPWWRRILPQRKPVAASSRPKESRSRSLPVSKYAVLMAIFFVLALVGFSLRDALGGAYQRVVDRVVGSEPVQPRMSASSSAPGAPATQANDGTSNKFWAPSASGDADGEFLRAEFDEPIRLLHVIVTPGVSTKQPEFLAAGRPRVLSLMVTDDEGKVSRERLELADTAGPQTFDVVHADVERLRLTIVSSKQGTRPGSPVAIAEVEFHGRS